MRTATEFAATILLNEGGWMPDANPIARLLVLSDPQIGLYRTVRCRAQAPNSQRTAAGHPSIDLPVIEGYERENSC